MARNKNEDNTKVKQKKNNKGAKPFLVAGLVLLGLALAIGAGWMLTSSIVLLRNSIYLVAAAGVGVGVATPIVKGISNAIAKRKQNNQNRQRTLNRERTREKEQTLESVPVPNRQKEELSDPMLFDKLIKEHNKEKQQNSQKK